MKTETETKETNLQTFLRYCRYNSGRHMLDSGGAYGRHWEKPAIAEKCPPVVCEARNVKWKGENGIDVCATIETGHFLADKFNVDREVQAQFDEWAAERDETWFESCETFCAEVLGLVKAASDNVYNGEQDLSQVYQWSVWRPAESNGDWIYDDEALTVIFIHTGCDVRGGYSAPLFCRTNGEYVVPLDLCAEFFADSGTDAEGNELTPDELRDIDEKWRSGYHSHPASAVADDCAEVLESAATYFVARLKTGETVRVVPSVPYN